MTNSFKGGGYAVLFTGLPAAGKTTLANALKAYIAEHENRYATLLDGDNLRTNLSSELGFSKEHRDLNVLRASYVAAEVVKHGGIAVCSLVAPYRKMRAYMREQVSLSGTFLEVYLATPLEVCEQRDPKGLYKKARRGVIRNFTGIDDPYEVPQTPELAINTAHRSVMDCLRTITDALDEKNCLRNKPSIYINSYV